MREVELTLTKEDLQPIYDKAYKEAQPLIDMKGFRKGKVPMNVVKKYFGKNIEANAVNDSMTDIFNKLMKEDDLRVVGTPQLVKVNETEENTVLTVMFEVLPDFELGDYKSLKLYEPVHVVNDEEIEYEIGNICINLGTFSHVESIEDEYNLVNLQMTPLDNDTYEPLAGREPYNSRVFLADKRGDGVEQMKEALMNRTKGDNFTFVPKKLSESEATETFNVKILDIEHVVPREYDNAMVEEYTKGRFNTTTDFREEVGFRLQEEWDKKTRHEIEEQIIGKLLEMHHDVDPPQAFIYNVMEAMVEDIKARYKDLPNKDKITVQSMYPSLYPVASKTVRWDIIRQRIVDAEGLKIEDHDIEADVEAESARYGIDKEEMKKIFFENPNIMNTHLNKKVFDFIIDFAEMEDISFEEYEKTIKPQHYGHDHNHDHDHGHNHDHDHDHDHEHETEEEDN